MSAEQTKTEAENFVQLDLLSWIEANKQRIGIGLGVVIVAVVGVMVTRWSKEQSALKSNAELFGAFTRPSPDEPADAPSDKLLAVASAHAGTAAGERALLLAAGKLFAEQKYEQAREKFESFVQTYPDSGFAPTARLGSASALDALNKTNEALSAYQAVATQFPKDFVANRAKMARAALLEASGQMEQAFSVYDELSKVTPMTMQSFEASQRRERLVASHPELVKTAQSLTNTVQVVSNAVATPNPAPTPTPAPAAEKK